MKSPVYTLKIEHDKIVLAIFSNVFVSLPPEFSPYNESVNASTLEVKALWDTGATHSAISDRLAAHLELPFEDFASVSTASGVQRVPIYPIHLALPNRLIFEELEAVEFTYSQEDGCDFIIGMDVMTQGDLSITNFEEKTVFSFRIPSSSKVVFEDIA
ncbi:MAG: retroviral-like aspartic protease family protein [Lewinellaceae bacterium]|nr:retroviral-like aspartic protease family protein [Lewinellaceae bacterium]